MYYFVRRITGDPEDKGLLDTTCFDSLERAREVATDPHVRHHASTEIVVLDGSSIQILEEYNEWQDSESSLV